MFRDHFYHETIKRSVSVFGTLFNNISIKRPDGTLIKVPLAYGPRQKWISRLQQVDLETSQAQSQELLREEWGKNYEGNLKRAAGVAKANLSAEVLDLQMRDGSRLGDNVDVIKGFAKIANLLSEDKIVATESETQMPNKDIETEISQIINNRQGPYWNKTHPDHDKTVQQVLTLREMIDGSSK